METLQTVFNLAGNCMCCGSITLLFLTACVSAMDITSRVKAKFAPAPKQEESE